MQPEGPQCPKPPSDLDLQLRLRGQKQHGMRVPYRLLGDGGIRPNHDGGCQSCRLQIDRVDSYRVPLHSLQSPTRPTRTRRARKRWSRVSRVLGRRGGTGGGIPMTGTRTRCRDCRKPAQLISPTSGSPYCRRCYNGRMEALRGLKTSGMHDRIKRRMRA